MRIAVTDQISLTEVRPTDKPAAIKFLNEQEIYDRTLRLPYPYTDAGWDQWYPSVEQAIREQGRPIHFAIRNGQDELIGGTGFDDLVIGKTHRAELGYWLAKPYWGRGIMTAVVRTLCEYALAEFGIVKITAHVFAFNIASVRVLEKCGFQLEGYLKKHYMKDGRYLDAKLYALVR